MFAVSRSFINSFTYGCPRAAHARLAVSWQASAANPPTPSDGGADISMFSLGDMACERSTHLLSSWKPVTSLPTMGANGVVPVNCLSTLKDSGARRSGTSAVEPVQLDTCALYETTSDKSSVHNTSAAALFFCQGHQCSVCWLSVEVMWVHVYVLQRKPQ